MTPDHKVEYDRLKSQLSVDYIKIDQELMAMPLLVQEAAELAANLADGEHVAKLALDIITAEVSASIREIKATTKPPSEAHLASVSILDVEVQKARNAYDESKFDSALGQSLYNSMRDKSRLLGKVCDMIVSGYLTPSAYPSYRQRGERK